MNVIILLSTFFALVNGHWTGQGTSIERTPSGREKTYRVDADVTFRRTAPSSFTLQINLTREDGRQTREQIRYKIQPDGQLMVSAAGTRDPVSILGHDSNSLSYQFSGAPIFGSPFEITHRFSASNDALDVHFTNSISGVTTRETSYSLRRF